MKDTIISTSGVLLLMACSLLLPLALSQQLRNCIFHPGYGACLRCGKTWDVVDGHLTPYAPSRMCFPLCEDCWAKLKTPEARLPYYHKMAKEWDAEDRDSHAFENVWPGMKENVLAGK